MIGHKTRMLNAYRGIYSDHYPVAPEFWCYYPAKTLGVDMMELELEVPIWKGILAANKKFDCDGWSVAGADALNPDFEVQSAMKSIGDGRYRSTKVIRCGGLTMECSDIYTKTNPSWVESYPVETEAELDAYVRASLSEDITYDFTKAREAYIESGEDILVEFNLGASFSDVFAGAMGYENTIMFFMSSDDARLEEYYEMFLSHQLNFLRQAAAQTQYESFFIGSNISNCSIFGPNLWRRWDKPYHMAIVEEAHKLGKLIHHHNHGKVMSIVPDFPEIGFDCVCPFERGPGDVNGMEGLKQVRRLLDGKVTFNGNVQTMETMIFGSTDDVRREVREIKEAFEGTPRLIIGTGDQIGYETPEENIWAMLDEGRKG